MALPDPNQPLPSTRRLITGHNPNGTANLTHNSLIHGTQTPHGPWIQLLWSAPTHPPSPNDTTDMGTVQTGLSNNGNIIRIVDFPPRSRGLMHRSTTVDYIFVLRGEVALVLDDGSRTRVGEGEVVVQRGTMHAWDNEADGWARLLCVLIKSERPVVGDRILEAEVPFQV